MTVRLSPPIFQGVFDPQPPDEERQRPRGGAAPQLLRPHAHRQANLRRGRGRHAQHPFRVSPGELEREPLRNSLWLIIAANLPRGGSTRQTKSEMCQWKGDANLVNAWRPIWVMAAKVPV